MEYDFTRDVVLINTALNICEGKCFGTLHVFPWTRSIQTGHDISLMSHCADDVYSPIYIKKNNQKTAEDIKGRETMGKSKGNNKRKQDVVSNSIYIVCVLRMLAEWACKHIHQQFYPHSDGQIYEAWGKEAQDL